MTDKRTYTVDKTSGEPYLFTREMEDHELISEYEYLAELLSHITGEIAFRADNPEYRDGTGDIKATHIELYEISDNLEKTLE